jgi:hypothetical protein
MKTNINPSPSFSGGLDIAGQGPSDLAPPSVFPPVESYNAENRGIQFNDNFAEDCNFKGYCDECPRWDEEGCKPIGEEDTVFWR